MNECYLCSLNEKGVNLHTIGNVVVDCNTCGYGSIHGDVFKRIVNKEIPVHLIQGYLRYMNDHGKKGIVITADNIESIIQSTIVPKNVLEQMDRLLLSLNDKTSYAGESILIDKKIDYTLAFCKNSKELAFLLSEMEKMGYVQFLKRLVQSHELPCWRILTNGWERIEELKNKIADTKQCFVAMAFEESTKVTYENGIYKAVKEAGYEPYRIDLEEHNELIPFSGYVIC